jgi:hypothetical protein
VEDLNWLEGILRARDGVGDLEGEFVGGERVELYLVAFRMTRGLVSGSIRGAGDVGRGMLRGPKGRECACMMVNLLSIAADVVKVTNAHLLL